MSNTKQLFEALGAARQTPLYRDVPDFDVDELVRLLGPRMVQTSGKDYAFAMHKEDPTDCSDRTDYFDWHSDGLYHVTPPRFVLLHCLNPGSGQSKTELADVSQVLAQLRQERVGVLRKLRSYYIGHGGSFDHPILTDRGMLLASRGYVSPRSDLPLEDHPALRDTSDALTELYVHLDERAVSYEWCAGGTLVFDQYRYMHRRNSAVVDRDRKLIRMWFT